MIAYPIWVGALGFDHRHAGIFLGGTIHDVAQVVGAGYMVSQESGDIATYVKMLRVAMLLPVVFVVALVLTRTEGTEKRKATLVPTFLLAFALLVIVNSSGVIPKAVADGISDVSRWCLVTAIAALGMKTSFKSLIEVGWRPVGLMVVETAWIALLVLVSVGWLI
jgi:uncharacterized integral membrane protein (TIGR00698 family)